MTMKSAQNAILLGMICMTSVVFSEPPSSGYGAPAPSGGYSGGGGNSGGGGYSGGGGSGGSGGGYGGGGGQGYQQQENYPPKPYNFAYAVNDHYSGANFRQQENSDGNQVNGQYMVLLPDGRTQIVKYNADWKNGFNAEVTYQGEAKYPDPPRGGYGNNNGGGGGGGGQGYGAPTAPQQSYGSPSGGSGGGYSG